MATATMPFRGASSAVIFEAILNRAPAPAIRLNPDLPAGLERVIDRALEKDRELRYQHASEMRSELLRLKRDTSTNRVPAANSGNNAGGASGEWSSSGDSFVARCRVLQPIHQPRHRSRRPAAAPLWSRSPNSTSSEPPPLSLPS